MTAAEQLAEMAERATGHAMNPWKVVDRLNEYRAVLRWFAEEVERRAELPLWKLSKETERSRAFIGLLSELQIKPKQEGE